MEILKFKTNIKCGGCVAAVTPFLDKDEQISKWQVDTESPDKLLSISGKDIDPQQIINLVEQAGYKAELVRVMGIGGGDL
ncbi:hypothetical protein GCM10023189_23620 [Nibrella saemangeumensis]|uniref:HMA domain-containing protein n=1 Tax=Nibrella saemangeumensis TaxID=1084526 RepID=A0ABP8MVR9_9BACT